MAQKFPEKGRSGVTEPVYHLAFKGKAEWEQGDACFAKAFSWLAERTEEEVGEVAALAACSVVFLLFSL